LKKQKRKKMGDTITMREFRQTPLYRQIETQSIREFFKESKMIDEIEQRTDQWFAARLGKVTASRVADVMAKTKTGYSASRENYMAQLVVERITGEHAESYTNASMQWGTDQEPFARAAYEAAKGVLVDEQGFVPHPTIEGAGASPDGLIGDDGLVEIKCPNTSTQIDTLLTGSIPSKYVAQMQFQMACTGRKWCDFVSYDPRMPNKGQLFIRHLERDDEYIANMESEIKKFLSELDEKVKKLKHIFGE
jgi:putative phage-type endonuclease